jgi:hypothetical protein
LSKLTDCMTCEKLDSQYIEVRYYYRFKYRDGVLSREQAITREERDLGIVAGKVLEHRALEH